MVQFGMMLVFAGASAAPYVKKMLTKTKRKKEIKKVADSSSTNMPQETETDTDLAIEAIEANEERHKYRFLMTTGTMGVAVIAQIQPALAYARQLSINRVFLVQYFSGSGKCSI